jgi:hypothetical protein
MTGLSNTISIFLGVFVLVLGCAASANALTWETSVHGDTASGVSRSGVSYDIGSCVHCHDVLDDTLCGDVAGKSLFAAQDTLCFAGDCHPDVDAQINASTVTIDTNGLSYTAYYSVNTRHDILDTDQAFSGAILECTNCHGGTTHKIDSVFVSGAIYSTLIDPDTGNAFTATTTHPGTGATMLDYTTFCETCHDGDMSGTGATAPTDVLVNIKSKHSAGSTAHGAGGSSLKHDLDGDYAAGTAPFGVMPCNDCHESHASSHVEGGIYHLKTLTVPIYGQETITAGEIALASDDYAQVRWCWACHESVTWASNHNMGNKADCFTCHSHAQSKW